MLLCATTELYFIFCRYVACFDNGYRLLDYILHWLWIYEGAGLLGVYFMSISSPKNDSKQSISYCVGAFRGI